MFEDYEWIDDQARQTFDEIKRNVNGIWRKAAEEARDQTPARIAEIRREAHEAAAPLLRDANDLRRMSSYSLMLA